MRSSCRRSKQEHAFFCQVKDRLVVTFPRRSRLSPESPFVNIGITTSRGKTIPAVDNRSQSYRLLPQYYWLIIKVSRCEFKFTSKLHVTPCKRRPSATIPPAAHPVPSVMKTYLVGFHQPLPTFTQSSNVGIIIDKEWNMKGIFDLFFDWLEGSSPVQVVAPITKNFSRSTTPGTYSNSLEPSEAQAQVSFKWCAMDSIISSTIWLLHPRYLF